MANDKSIQSQMADVKSMQERNQKETSDSVNKLVNKLRKGQEVTKVADSLSQLPKSAIKYKEQQEGLKVLSDGLDVQANIEKHEDLNAVKSELSNQGALTEELSDLISKLRKEPERSDLSPLLSVLDSQLGTNMLATYKKPDTKAESLAKAIRMHTELQDIDLKKMQLMQTLRGDNSSEVFSQEDRQYYKNLGIRDSELDRIASSPATATYQINKLVLQRTPSEKQMSKIQDLDNVLVTLNELGNEFDPSYIGPTKEFMLTRTPEVLSKPFQDPKAAAWRSKVGRFFDTYRKAITGAQASVKELDLLRKNVPNIGDTPEQFKEKVKSFGKVFNRIRRNTLEKYNLQGKYADRYLDPAADEVSKIIEMAEVGESINKQEEDDLGFESVE